MQIKRKVTEQRTGDTAHRIAADLGGGGEGWCLVVVARRSFCFNVPLYVGRGRQAVQTLNRVVGPSQNSEKNYAGVRYRSTIVTITGLTFYHPTVMFV